MCMKIFAFKNENDYTNYINLHGLHKFHNLHNYKIVMKADELYNMQPEF
jgi:hypothetical protein